MTKKKEDLSTRFMQSLIDQETSKTVDLMNGASDRDIRKLFETMVSVTRMVAGYAAKRGVDISGTEGAIVMEVPDPGNN